jgi:predicted transcriptional regulator
MIIRSTRITIVKISKPHEKDINQELQWFGSSLGLFNLRDKDKSCYRIFLELVKAAKIKEALSSDELADRLNLTRGTVIHHLNKLMEAGIVMHYKNKYALRVERLGALMEELQNDIEGTLKNLREIAYDIDRSLNH